MSPIRQLESVILRARNYFAPRDLRFWTVLLLCLTFSIALMIGTGGSLQLYVVSLLNGDASSIYGSVYKESIVKYPSLQQWLLNCANFPFPAMALVVAAYSLRGLDARQTFAQVVVAAFLVLFLYDVTAGAFAGQLSASFLFENLVADLAGGFVISFLTIAFLTACDAAWDFLPGDQIARLILACVFLVFLGLFGCTAFYYTARFFYEPMPTKFDALLEQPTYGQYFSLARTDQGKRVTSENHDLDPFALIPSNVVAKNFVWRGGTEDALVVDWKRPMSPESFGVTLEAFTGCTDNLSAVKASDRLHGVEVQNVHQLNLSFDPGSSDFMSGGDEEDAGKIKIETVEDPVFWLRTGKQTEFIELSQLLDAKARLSFSKSVGSLEFYFVAPLIRRKSGNLLETGRRELVVVVDSKKFKIDLQSKVPVNDLESVKCKSIELGSLSEQKKLDLSPTTFVGFLVRIHSREYAGEIYGKSDNHIFVSGSSGWVTSNFSRHDLAYAKSGQLRMLSFKGSIGGLHIDDLPVTARPTDQYGLTGDFIGQFETSGHLRVTGTANSVVKDGMRMNQTRFERLSWTVRAILLTTASSLFLLLFKLVMEKISTRYTFRLPLASATSLK